MTRQPIGSIDELAKRLLDCEPWVERLSDQGGLDSSKTLKKLREQFGGELAAIVSATSSLQQQARVKLAPHVSHSPIWWVNEKSLQQATAWQVAKAKAVWFGDQPVLDLCCGIGGDAVYLAARGEMTAVDRDPWVAAMAQANLWNHASSDLAGKVVCDDVCHVSIPASSAIHIDPDRRPGQQRRSDPDAFEPSWMHVSRIVTATSSAVIKLAPASRVPEQGVPESELHRCWISLSGSVREQSLLFGDSVERAGQQRGQRSAMVVRADGSATTFATDPSAQSVHPINFDGAPAVLVDPNAAIRAAGLTEALANHFQLGMLNGPAGFLAADDLSVLEHALLRKLAVVSTVRLWCVCDDRKLRKELRALGVYPQSVKVRGSDHDPAVLTKRYRSCGDQPVTLWIGRHGNRTFAAITDCH